jgi:hypothetical protein
MTMNNKMTRRMFGASGFALLLAGSASFAQQSPPVRLRGAIEKVDGNLLDVKLRDGTSAKIKLKDDAAIRGIVAITLADVKAGSMVGITSVPQADGTLKAVEVHTFPPQQRVNEGHGPYDTVPNSMMTNARVETSIASVEGQVLTVQYKQGDKVEEKKIMVPLGIPLQTAVPGDKSDLKVGGKFVAFNAIKQADGTYEVATISIGRNGLAPAN